MNHGWQSESTDGPKGGWNAELSIYPSICLSICLSVYCFFLYPCIYLSTYPSSCLTTYPLSVYLPIHLSVFPSICLALYLSTQPSINQTACLVCLSIFFLFFSFEIYPFPCLSVCLSTCLSVYPDPLQRSHACHRFGQC